MKKVIGTLIVLALATAASVAYSAPITVTLVADNQRSSSGTRSFLSWKTCPPPVPPADYVTPCVNPTNQWVIDNGVTGSTAVWTWDAATGILSSTGVFWSTSYISSNPAGKSVISDKTTDLTIDTTNMVTTATNYVCYEGNFLGDVGANGCGNYDTGANFASDSPVMYNVGGDPYCVVRTLTADDTTTGNPRGVTNFDGTSSCDPTDGAYLNYVIVQDDTATGGQLVLADDTWPSTCYTTPTALPECAGATWLTFMAAGATAVDDTANATSGTVQIPVMANDTGFTDPVTVAVSTPPTQGTAVVTGSPGPQAGITIGYTPNLGATGTDTFVYTATDADGVTSSSATVTVTVTVIDTSPDAMDGSITISTQGVAPAGRTGTFTAPGPGGSLGNTGGTAAVTVTAQGTKGTATVAGNIITYTITDATFFTGTDTFTYLITDADGETDSAVVTVTIPNVLPTLADGSVVTTAGTAAAAVSLTTVLGNGSAAQNVRTVTTAASHGTCTLSASGATTSVAYTPSADYTGPDSCVVTITDGNSDTDTGTLSVTVNAASGGGGDGGGGGSGGPQLPPAGGSLDLWSLSLFGIVTWLRRRRVMQQTS